MCSASADIARARRALIAGGIAGAVLGACLACAGGAPGPDDPHPVPELPESFTGRPRPVWDELGAGEVVCGDGATRWTWRPDAERVQDEVRQDRGPQRQRQGTFEAVTPKAKFTGTWRRVDDDLAYLTTGPLGEARGCSLPRFLDAGDRRWLLCAEGPLGCTPASKAQWAIEVVDAGAGAPAAELVARVLAGVDAEAFGPGVIVAGEAVPPSASAERARVIVRYRDEGAALRRLAEQAGGLLARDLDTAGVTVVEDGRIHSPVVVAVAGPVAVTGG